MSKNTDIPEQVHSFNLNDYIDWFDKVNINTLIWQAIVVFFLWRFRKEIGKVVFSIVAKIPQIESVSLTGVKLTDTTIDVKLEELTNVIKKSQTTKERE